MALGALAFSLLGFLCMWGFGGLLAIALGIMARGEIERSGGRLDGKKLATAGIALGCLNLVACAVGLGVAITLLARPSAHSSSAGSPPYTTPFAPPPSTAPAPPSSTKSRSTGGNASRDDGVVLTRIGEIELVDLGGAVHSLGDELDKQRAEARRGTKKLVLWTVQRNCQPCNGVAAALTDPAMQTALSGTRLVRLDPQDFRLELQQFNIPTEKIPGFALLGTDNHPLDYVNGGEWDEDVAKNIAPVLGKFVRGAYKQRRDPWRGGTREDETAL